MEYKQKGKGKNGELGALAVKQVGCMENFTVEQKKKVKLTLGIGPRLENCNCDSHWLEFTAKKPLSLFELETIV